MTPRLPTVTPIQMISALKRVGFSVKRQRGSHVILKRSEDKPRIVVPMHPGDLKRGLTRAILHQAKLSVDEFLKLI